MYLTIGVTKNTPNDTHEIIIICSFVKVIMTF